MLNAYLRRMILGYLCNAAARMRHHSPEGREFAKWVLEGADQLALPGYAENPQLLKRFNEREELSAAQWARLAGAGESPTAPRCS